MPVELESPELRRCAIYTRKSLDQEREMEFNSLETQRAICSAYILSQSHKGWLEIPTSYDDGGQSGATLDRPQLQKLMADIDLGLIDAVIVYKLDRITRSLLDFVRLSEYLDRYGVSFVSITQNFDTSDSLGRLILNVLLTFAQFEREIFADRLRDKQRLVRRSGRWASGVPPMGYRVKRHILHIYPPEAKIVEFIFNSFVQIGTFNGVAMECQRLDLRACQNESKNGKCYRGKPICAATVSCVLRNPVYIGMFRVGDEIIPALHKPIIEKSLWDRAQALRQTRIMANRDSPHKRYLLPNLLRDCYGRPMSIHHCRGGKGIVNAYYASSQSKWGRKNGLPALRARAEPLDRLICECLEEFLSNRPLIRSGLLKVGCYDKRLETLSARTDQAVRRLHEFKHCDLRATIHSIFARLELSNDRLKAVIRWREVRRLLEWDGIGIFRVRDGKWDYDTKVHLLEIPCNLVRDPRKLCIPIEPRATNNAQPVAALVQLIRDARRAQSLVDTDRTKPVSVLAKRMHFTGSRFVRLLRLNYLAPDIVTAILDGAQPQCLTKDLLLNTELPLDWALQRRLFGFEPGPLRPGC